MLEDAFIEVVRSNGRKECREGFRDAPQARGAAKLQRRSCYLGLKNILASFHEIEEIAVKYRSITRQQKRYADGK